jgi:hypothetical protein
MGARQFAQTLELVQDLHEFSMARMELFHFELFSLEPVSTEVTIDLELWARVFEMLLDTL